MPTRGSTQINTFVKGLLTEASPLAFPPNTALDILNFRLNKDGSIHRRLGIDVEEGGAFYNFNISAEVLATARKSFYRWQNPNGNPNRDIGVVQLGSFFWFINLFAPAPSIALLNGGNPIDAGVDHRTRFSMATINGYLAVVSAALDTPFLVTYNEATDSITYETADIMVRDIWGVDDFMTEYHRPSDLNDEHRYNLRNQGWSPNIITTCGPGIDAVSCTFLTHSIYPSNSDHWSIGRIEDLTSADVYKYDPNIAARNIVEQGQTAKGSMIINLYNRGSSRMALTGINLPLDRDRGRVSTIASYAGRIFYSGIYSDQIGTDARSPKLSNIVLFSQLFINKVDLVKCYQQADPTSIDFSDIVDTDGGLIQIPECGQVTRLMTVKDSLFVFATNGIWRIRGDEGGFRATSFQVDKISNVFCSSPDSIIELNGTIFLWGIDGIYSLVPNETGMYNTVSLTIPTIQTLYNSLPDISKLQAKGFYDLSQNRLRWLYYSDESKVSGDPIDTPAPGPIVPSTTIGASSTLSESASAIKVARISDTSFCIVYTKGASPSSLKAVVCTFDPITLAVTFGTAVTVRVTSTQASVNIYAHDTNKVLIIHTDSPSVNALATVLTISGTSITVGAVNTLFATGGNFASVFPVALSSTKAILTYKPAGTGEARILTIAGNVVTTSSATTIGTATTMGAADKIDSTRVILLYGDGSGNEVVVLSAPSTTITVGTPLNIQAFTVGSLNDMSINVLPSGGRATILGRGTSAQLRQTIISISGTSLTRDSAADYTSVNTTVFNSQWHSILNSNISVCVSNNNDSGTRYPYLEVNKAYTSVINNYISRQLLESLMAANIHTAKITDDKIVWVALNGTSSGNILTQVLQIT